MDKAESESQEFLLHEGKRDLKCPRCSWRQKVTLFSFGGILFIFLSIVLFIVSVRRDINDSNCAKLLSPYSPAIDAVEYEWVTPGAILLHELELINVPVEKLPALNKSTAGPWRHLTREQGGGVAGFIEVFHQLHCLNLVRQFTYRDSYNYSMEVPFGDTAAMLRLHVDHCIETIRLNLMCAGDVTPFLVTLDPQNKLGESPDFETLHRCRRFDKLAEWSKSHVASHELLKNEPGRKEE
ncbi:Cyclochlorotine biosynthesis protein O [Colletotrichum orbiculare MAFF 240422]|uniref:Cyclochlorotine biosynthesis protein O n=1 Tax=Colletotrichum orbiculare (strain 104-T / ATCC 96160 / CBS 514.97 / LARS 414 / MAFF 240422) TaxID=1213857 RepID=A0A484FSX6_COLOR|nr:Cyclochlorotine biosynthesis protein O [Colletotrichum orbiculare MAFF 240422]